jgi:hypothetical protein
MRMGNPMKRKILVTAALFIIAMSARAQSALPAAPATSTVYADTIGEKTVTCEKVEGGNGLSFRTTFYVFINLTLDHIESSFERSQYATTRAAIVKKYGPPTRTTIESYTTCCGVADLQGELADWEQPGFVILLNECERWGSSNFIIFKPVGAVRADQSY